uniref:Uncharacterized protein n=1 Tax=Trichogramma kaykai TaxID=54128 RepID=A0ABD2WKD1_9HYME
MKPLLARYLRCLRVRARAAKAMPDVRARRLYRIIPVALAHRHRRAGIFTYSVYTDVRVEEKKAAEENKIEMIHRFRNYYYSMPRRTESNIHPKGNFCAGRRRPLTPQHSNATAEKLTSLLEGPSRIAGASYECRLYDIIVREFADVTLSGNFHTPERVEILSRRFSRPG